MYYLFNTGNLRSNAINLHVEEDRVILNESEHFLTNIKKRTDFRPYCKMLFPLKQTSIDQRNIEDSFGGKHSYPYSMPPFDSYTYTSDSKMLQDEIEPFLHSSMEVSFIFFPHTKNFMDAILLISKPSDINVPFKVTKLDKNKNIIDYIPDKIFTESVRIGPAYPKCTLQIIDKEKTFNSLPVYDILFTYNDIDGNFVECDFDAYVKTSCGYISHRKIKVKNGKATFRYIPIGVNDDEQAEIQVGIGKYSNITGILKI
jgi:hypothetical protein